MERQKKALYYLDAKGHGLEIGPSHNPITPKKEGYNVDIIDHLSQDELKEKYKLHGVNLDNIEAVDFVWHGQPYAELTGKTKFYDWIIASHLIEHTPDLIGFLNDCDSVLKEHGVISLVIPDKRYCFDYFRPLTGLGKIVDAHYQKYAIHTPGTAAEYYLNVVRKGNDIAWNQYNQGNYAFVHTLTDALESIDAIINRQTYLDVHAWCFTPSSFRLIIEDLYALGYISVREVGFFPTSNSEFYITLGHRGQGHGLSRLELVQSIEAELWPQIPAATRTKNLSERLLDKLKQYLRPLKNRLTGKP